MGSDRPKQALESVADRLGELLHTTGEDRLSMVRASGRADLVARFGRFDLAVKYRSSSDAAAVSAAIAILEEWRGGSRRPAIPIVAVPFMGQTGHRLCLRAGMSWLDLSGNAWIQAAGMNIQVRGHPNALKRRGRPSNAFAPKSSRVTRVLLLDPKRWWTQQEIAETTRIGAGFVSRIVRRLESGGYVERDSSGALRPKNPGLLLDAWRASYDFDKHTVLRGHIAAKSGQRLTRELVTRLSSLRTEFALTGLAAAWQQTEFAAYRLSTVYVHQPLSKSQLSSIGFRPEARGANVWLVTPRDEGVFDGQKPYGGFPCVSAVQVCLDLDAHPERSSEAAEVIRKEMLAWAG